VEKDYLLVSWKFCCMWKYQEKWSHLSTVLNKIQVCFFGCNLDNLAAPLPGAEASCSKGGQASPKITRRHIVHFQGVPFPINLLESLQDIKSCACMISARRRRLTCSGEYTHVSLQYSLSMVHCAQPSVRSQSTASRYYREMGFRLWKPQ